MIKTVTVTNYTNDSLVITMSDPEPASGLIIKSIDGIGAAEATINTTNLSTNDGSIYNSARLKERNIVFEFLFTTQNPTAEEARRLTYKYFPVKKKLRLDFVTDGRSAFIYGYVESNKPDIFSQESGCQISVICPDPYFYAVDGKTVTTFSGIESLFYFPFYNRCDFTEIVFGKIESISSRTIYYSGDANVGVLVNIHATGVVVNPTIYNVGTQEFVTIDTSKLETLTGHGLIAGDDITISTVRGNKSITLLRDGNYYNILNTIGRHSDWFQLSEGDNVFAYVADDGGENMMVGIENEIIYEGI